MTVTVLLQSLMVLLQSGIIFIVSGSGSEEQRQNAKIISFADFHRDNFVKHFRAFTSCSTQTAIKISLFVATRFSNLFIKKINCEAKYGTWFAIHCCVIVYLACFKQCFCCSESWINSLYACGNYSWPSFKMTNCQTLHEEIWNFYFNIWFQVFLL